MRNGDISGPGNGPHNDPQVPLTLQLRQFARTHNWHEPDIITNRLKLRRAFAKPIRAAVNDLVADRRDALALQIKAEFARLLENTRALDRLCVKRIDEDDELVMLEHTKAHLAESLCDLAVMLDGGQEGAQGDTQRSLDPGSMSGMTAQEPWMTFAETAKLLGKSKSTVSKWAKKGRFSDNGLKGQKRRLSKASVLLVKREIEENDRKKDDDEWHDQYGKS
jgi:excisionase family DNA binding protein